MTKQFSPEVEELIQRQMASGKYGSEDELMRQALSALAEENAELKVLEEALDAVEAGHPGVPLDEAFAALRKAECVIAPTSPS